MERVMLMLLKSTEARLQAVQNRSVRHFDTEGKIVVPVDLIEETRADLYLAILELKDKVK